MAVLMVESMAFSMVVLKDYLTAVMLVLWMDSLKVVQMVAWSVASKVVSLAVSMVVVRAAMTVAWMADLMVWY